MSDLATAILDPVLRKRAGISIGLVQSWEEIAGPRLASQSRPEKIQWPRRLHEDDPFEPAMLVIACEGMAALHLQHETGEIIARVNAFLGFNAIGRITHRAEAGDRHDDRRRSRARGRLTAAEKREAVTARSATIEDDGLRASLERLGATIIGTKQESHELSTRAFVIVGAQIWRLDWGWRCLNSRQLSLFVASASQNPIR